MRTKLTSCLIAIAMGAFAAIACGAEWERAISLDQAVKAADAAAGFSKGRPNYYDIISAKLMLARRFSARKEGLSDALQDMESLSSPAEFWLIVYRRWPPSTDTGIVVFIDARTGKSFRVFRHGKT